ncbi:hypothetical protein [Halomonas sp. SCS19]|uniref:hypothetical protein n=1 Tax=Halomonas sp. SCS19 TaxID=2950870 RepID=UPI0032DF9BD9
MKLNRNTSTASHRAAEVKNEKRAKLRNHIAQYVIPDFCRNNDCPGALKCGKEVFMECVSYNDLAGSLNTLNVETLAGKRGNWKAQMVKNLFK